jgi:hypothetical protein
MAVLSRRVFLGSLPALALAEIAGIPSELKRFRDPSTEFEVLRYTEPQHASYLIPAELRSVSQKSNFLLFCSDRSGSNQVYRLDTKNGEMRQVTSIEGVQPSGVALLPDDRSFCCLHEGHLDLFPINAGKHRLLYEGDATQLGLHDNGRLIVCNAQGVIRSIGFGKHEEQVLFEAGAAIDLLRPRPQGNSLLYRKAGKYWLLDYASRKETEVHTDLETVPCLYWSSDGTRVYYLCRPEGGRGVQLREHFPDSGEDKLIAPTSQFAGFAANRNGSVFVGVSGSKGAPYVLLLLRVARRELTLADHRSKSPADSVIFFTPDSQRIFFEGDRSGKSCIYGIPAERLVEATNS